MPTAEQQKIVLWRRVINRLKAQVAMKAGNVWVQILIGAILGGGISLPLFRSFFCFYTFQEPSTKFLFAAASLLMGLFGNKINEIKDNITRKIIFF